MDRDKGWHTGHKVGDLIRVTRKTTIGFGLNEDIGDIGVVLKCPGQTDGILFVEVYMFKDRKVRWYSPTEIDIISNIDE